jgi:hypothetical protein
MKRLLSVLSAASVVLGVGLATAAPAQAVPLEADIYANGCLEVDYRVPVGTTVALYYDGTDCVFDNYAFESGYGEPEVNDLTEGGEGWIAFTVQSNRDWGISWPANEDAEQYVTGCAVTYLEADYYDSVVDLCGDGKGTPPPSWYESYGRPSADAVCLEGWTPSWAQWMNAGTGGFTCDRETYWDVAKGGWATR